jgi:hypothetical protein
MMNPQTELMNTGCFFIKELVINSLMLKLLILKSADDIFKKEVKTCQI